MPAATATFPTTRIDTVLVGAGPIGLELAVSLKHLGADYVHLEAGNIAQTVTWYPKQTRYFSSPQRIAIAGVPLITDNGEKATREQYLAYLRGVVQQFDLPVRSYTPVESVERKDDGRFLVRTPNETFDAKHVVLAIGDMHAPRKLGVPGEDLPHVSHYFDEPHRYFGQRLLIVGGKNSAVEAALRCHHAGAKVDVSYRGEAFPESSIKYWLLPEINALIKHGQIAFHPHTEVAEIQPGKVVLRSNTADKTETVPADFVLLLTGYVQDPTLFKMAGVTLDGENHAPTLDPDTMMTDVPNLFVAGTAAAGTQQRFKLFIENCHPHVRKIAKAITGKEPPRELINNAAETFGLAES